MDLLTTLCSAPFRERLVECVDQVVRVAFGKACVAASARRVLVRLVRASTAELTELRR